MESVAGEPRKKRGKASQLAKKIINRKLEIAENILDHKLDILDGFMRRKEQSKQKIRAAAGELFNKYGLKRVTIDDIATKARVSQVTIYNLFGSKENLVVDWMKGLGDKFIESLRGVSNSNKPYYERVEDVINMMVGVTEANPSLADNEALDLPETKLVEGSFIKEISNLFVDFIHQGQKEGYLNPDISDEAISAYTEILIRGMNSSTEVHARTHHDSKLFHDLILIMLFGFSRPKTMIKNKFSV